MCLNMPEFVASLEYELIKILNHLLHTLCNLVVQGIIIEGELIFYSKRIVWSGLNKGDYEVHLIRGDLLVSGSRIHQNKSWHRLYLTYSNILASHIIIGKHQ